MGKYVNKIVLCGHTGSRNRGCEAIIRTTSQIFKKAGVQGISSMTFDLLGDQNVHLDQDISLIPYPKKNQFIRACSLISSKILRNPVWGNAFYSRGIVANADDDTLLLNVGGDTYCYGMPWISIGMNQLAQKKGIRTVFWGCSVDETLDKSKKLQEDINRYSCIVCRESLSYEILKRNYHGEHLYLCCDPAFQLPVKETELPDGFVVHNTVGINLSPVMVDINNLEESMAYRNICELIRYLTEETDMHICLIPHVYQIEPAKTDYVVLRNIYERFKSTGRVSIVDRELDCRQLKYIISQCRFFVGARTHSTIAAYSTEVPTLALSYSIKARGLAMDIMGSEEKYSMSWKALQKETDIRDCFVKNIMMEESRLRERLGSLMPEYKNTILDVAQKVINI